MKTRANALISGNIFPFLSLLVASSVGVGLIVLRICYTGRFHQLYLVSNLVLAWLPLAFALMARRSARTGRWRSWRFLAPAFAWVIFFPNSPYIFTDPIHLHGLARGHFWVDLLVILLFAWTGFILGFVRGPRLINGAFTGGNSSR